VELFLDQENSMLGGLIQEEGLKLVVHNPKNPPLVDEQGIRVKPKTAISVAVKQVKLSNFH